MWSFVKCHNREYIQKNKKQFKKKAKKKKYKNTKSLVGVYVPAARFAFGNDMQKYGRAQNEGVEIVKRWLNDFYNEKKRSENAISKYEDKDNQIDIVLDKLTQKYNNDIHTLAIDVHSIFIAC